MEQLKKRQNFPFPIWVFYLQETSDNFDLKVEMNRFEAELIQELCEQKSNTEKARATENKDIIKSVKKHNINPDIKNKCEVVTEVVHEAPEVVPEVVTEVVPEVVPEVVTKLHEVPERLLSVSLELDALTKQLQQLQQKIQMLETQVEQRSIIAVIRSFFARFCNFHTHERAESKGSE